MDDSHKNFITLKSKLTPPRIDATVERRRLTDLLQDMDKYKLVSITAGPGYGKTTLAAQACRRSGIKTVWYRLDESDNDAITWMYYLIDGIRRHFKSFGSKTLARIQSTQNFHTELHSLWTILLHEIELSIDEPLIIVLDDFHLIQGREEIRRTIGFILEHLPDGMHMVITGRTTPDINLSRLIAQRDVIVIGEKELTFTPSEISKLYQQIFHLSLSDDGPLILEKKTNGWAAGLVLLHFSIRNKTVGLEQPQGFLSAADSLFEEYIEENIYKLLPTETIAFLLQTSLLSRLEVNICNRLLGIDNAGEILQQLETSHMFTFVSEYERSTYHYHNIFKNFLRNKLTTSMNRADLNNLYCKAAALLQENNDFNGAIRCFLNAGEFEAASGLLIEKGFAMIEGGQINQVLTHCGKIPAHLLGKKPWIIYLVAVASIRQGKLQEAFDSFEQAGKLFECNQDSYGIGLCRTYLAVLHNVRGDFTKAEETLSEIERRSPPNPETHLDSLAASIFMNIRIGNLQAADQYFDQAQAIINSLGKNPKAAVVYYSYSYRFFSTDNAHELLYYGRKTWHNASRFNKYRLMALSCNMISYAYFVQGEYDLSYSEAQKGIQIFESSGSSGIAYAMCHIHAAWAMIGKENLSAAADHCNQGMKISSNIQSDWTNALIYATACFIQVKMGDLDQAEVLIVKAREFIDHTQLGFEKSVLKVIFALVLLLKGRADESAILIRSTRKYPFYSKILRRWIELIQVRVNWQSGRLKNAKEILAGILGKLSPDEKDYFLMDQQDWIIPLLVEVYADRHTQKQITTLLTTFKTENLKVLQELSTGEKGPSRTAARSLLKALSLNAIDDLHIRCFGTFTLTRSDHEITCQNWVSTKARTLFKYLALHFPSGFISKDKLLEMLWPDQDPFVTTKRLHVALSTIRKVLEPELARGDVSSYLHREKDAYRLTLGKNGSVDAVLFDQLLTKARETENSEKKLARYLFAERLYRGELFEDEPYSQWCMEHREAYRRKYVSLLVNIADNYQAAGKPAECIEYLRRVLELDDCAEEIYCRLMSLYHQTGNRIMAKKTYQSCKQRLQVELDCPLSNKTEELYSHIMSG